MRFIEINMTGQSSPHGDLSFSPRLTTIAVDELDTDKITDHKDFGTQVEIRNGSYPSYYIFTDERAADLKHRLENGVASRLSEDIDQSLDPVTSHITEIDVNRTGGTSIYQGDSMHGTPYVEPIKVADILQIKVSESKGYTEILRSGPLHTIFTNESVDSLRDRLNSNRSEITVDDSNPDNGSNDALIPSG